MLGSLVVSYGPMRFSPEGLGFGSESYVVSLCFLLFVSDAERVTHVGGQWLGLFVCCGQGSAPQTMPYQFRYARFCWQHPAVRALHVINWG